jgi:hypothetical protein
MMKLGYGTVILLAPPMETLGKEGHDTIGGIDKQIGGYEGTTKIEYRTDELTRSSEMVVAEGDT